MQKNQKKYAIKKNKQKQFQGPERTKRP